jgi:leader peptidase (prepilin peptidase)/N-methyltransferase
MPLFVLFLLGLALGSFVNAFVFRLHEAPKAKSKELRDKLSITNGRSMCVHCHHKLAWYDLLPVISWLSLRGKCRYCSKRISVQYPLVEIGTALLFVLSYVYWPYSSDFILLFIFWLVFIVGFMALIIYDLRWMLLPNVIVLPLTVLSLVYVLVYALLAGNIAVITDAILGMASIGGLFYILFQTSSGKWIGGGDVKLGFVLGILAGGLMEGLMVIFIASLLGTLFAILSAGHKKQTLKKRIPFGPFLIIALIIVYLFSADIISWYQQQIFLV